MCIKAYYVQALFKSLRIFFFLNWQKKNLSFPPQNGAYILGLHREPDHLATQTSKMYSDLRELSWVSTSQKAVWGAQQTP